MSPREFERLLEALGLSKAGAGRWLGISERTVHRYADGDAEVPVSTVFLLRLMVEQGRLPKVPQTFPPRGSRPPDPHHPLILLRLRG